MLNIGPWESLKSFKYSLNTPAINSQQVAVKSPQQHPELQAV